LVNSHAFQLPIPSPTLSIVSVVPSSFADPHCFELLLSALWAPFWNGKAEVEKTVLLRNSKHKRGFALNARNHLIFHRIPRRGFYVNGFTGNHAQICYGGESLGSERVACELWIIRHCEPLHSVLLIFSLEFMESQPDTQILRPRESFCTKGRGHLKIEEEAPPLFILAAVTVVTFG
jgi:hypothetical protein